MASMYESKIKALNESVSKNISFAKGVPSLEIATNTMSLIKKFQMADSKAIRFHRMIQSMKEKMAAETGKRTVLEEEIIRLQTEVLKVQDLLTTTESNYKSQLEVMTDFVTELQQELSRRQ